MSKINSTVILIHSPLVGVSTWSLVAEEMRQRSINVIVPELIDSPDSTEPFWKQHVESINRALARLARSQAVTLVAHSGAGPLLPAIGRSLDKPVNAYIFVDAGIPHDGATRLDMMNIEDPQWARQFQSDLEIGASFPNWDSDDLRMIIPDKKLRKQVIAEIRPRKLDFFSEPIPVFKEWPNAPCIYIQFSEAYNRPATWAQQAGWKTHKLVGGHFHMLVDPNQLTNVLLTDLQ